MVEGAIEAMSVQLEKLGNPSSLHTQGRAVRKELEQAREQLAKVIGCHASEIIFTGSGTEANNTALKGLFWKNRLLGRNVVVISAIEHHAILDPAQWLHDHDGAEVIAIGVDKHGVGTLRVIGKSKILFLLRNWNFVIGKPLVLFLLCNSYFIMPTA